MRGLVRISWVICAALSACNDGGATEGSSGDTGLASTSTPGPTSSGDATTVPEPTSDPDPTGGSCVAPLAVCDGLCVDTEHDPAHCGGCGTVCTSAPAGAWASSHARAVGAAVRRP